MRSLLFVPGDSEKKLAKAVEGDADALIIDLEDSVSETNKMQAREITKAFVAQHRSGSKTLVVRVNPLDSPHHELDLDTIMPVLPAMLMLPKATPSRLAALAASLDQYEADAAVARCTTKLLTVSTETPGALFGMDQYLDTTIRLVGMSWGAEDLAAEIGATTNKRADGTYTDVFRLARSLTLLAARHANVLAIDSVYTDFKNEAGLRAELAEAVRDGFDAKLAIHPAQVPVINEALTPSADELAHARAVVAAFEASPDAGVLSLDGKMIDKPHLKQAQRVLMRSSQP